MTTEFRIHIDQLGKAQAAKHMMLINGIEPFYKLAIGVKSTVYPNGFKINHHAHKPINNGN